jgi:nucleoside-triphosphatase
MGRTLLITGLPGVGKTTIVKQVAQALGPRAGGFYTEEIRGPGGRKGFRLATFPSGGRQAVLAHVDIRTRNRVGRYGVDVATLDAVGVAAMREAVQSREVVVVDEIGKMELFSGEFQGAVLKAMSSPKIVVATVMHKSHAWVNALKAMPQVTVWQVTESNREEMSGRVVEWIEGRNLALLKSSVRNVNADWYNR